MEYLDKVLEESLTRYFAVLEKTGFVRDSDVCRLILLSFLLEFLNEYLYYITEEDYNIINKIVACLAGKSCLIPYREYIEQIQPVLGYLLTVPVRITQPSLNSKVRQTETPEAIRLVNL